MTKKGRASVTHGFSLLHGIGKHFWQALVHPGLAYKNAFLLSMRLFGVTIGGHRYIGI